MNTRTRNRLQARDAAYLRIHAWLRDNPQAHTVAEIAVATNDDADIHRTGIALSQMARCAYVVRTGSTKTGWRYRVGDVAPRTFRDTRTVTASRPATTTSSRAPSLDQQRDRIAADIAAFEARGGRIQRLGVTQLFRQSRAAND
ncbi:hypothetical protein [Luteimonas fraxinea]|uniref:Uncharacterized protein n=1 Tax=Luteimonas fraxinea TaxID=2901869 RepID=A0ABS8UEX8_9GAMM|nr:hypothetical protein [Luteimonas fraxinea]MCD9097075.1 hypothetical protein [Luteimonas fraxinea]